MHATLRGRTRFAFLWIALIPVALAVIAVWLSGQFRLELAWVQHTYDVRTQIRDLVQSAADAQDALREYVLTGKDQYIQAMYANSALAEHRLEMVRRLTIDNTVQQSYLRDLVPLVRQLSSRIPEVRAMSPEMRQARAAAIDAEGDRAMSRVRTAARDMLREEERLLLVRTERQDRTSSEVEAIFVAAVIVTLALLFWAGRRMREYAAQRDRAEAAMQRTLKQFAALNRDLEGRVEERTGQLRKVNASLAASNQDLERFAFIASHDLQEPLRMVTLFSQLLQKAYHDTLDAKATGYLNNIIDATERMRELLKSLLTYAEVGVYPDEVTKPVDLNVVLTKAMQILKPAMDDTGAAVVSAQLPVMKVSEGHFLQLFQNLIGNAIKYRSARPSRIEISVKLVDDHFRFAVADNGMGIEPEYHEKIFVAFKRLHGRQIPGTGIGLAICKRVLDHYGGRIWVESQPDMGATFIFTLPVSLRCKEAAPPVEQEAPSRADA